MLKLLNKKISKETLFFIRGVFTATIIFIIVFFSLNNFKQNPQETQFEQTTQVDTTDVIDTVALLNSLPIPIDPYSFAGSSKYVWVIDAGHGGVIDNIYQTPGKRSPRWLDGRILYEGEFNQDIANRVYLKCKEAGYKCIKLRNTHIDISLEARRNTIETMQSVFGNIVSISIHANGSIDANNPGKGWSVYTSTADNKSDVLSDQLYTSMKQMFPDETFRDGSSTQKDRETDQFTMVVLRDVVCVLTENFFMDNEKDCQRLMSSWDREKIAQAHFNAIKALEESTDIELYEQR